MFLGPKLPRVFAPIDFLRPEVQDLRRPRPGQADQPDDTPNGRREEGNDLIHGRGISRSTGRALPGPVPAGGEGLDGAESLQQPREDREFFVHAPPEERPNHPRTPVHLPPDAAVVHHRLTDRLEAGPIELGQREVGEQPRQVPEGNGDILRGPGRRAVRVAVVPVDVAGVLDKSFSNGEITVLTAGRQCWSARGPELGEDPLLFPFGLGRTPGSEGDHPPGRAVIHVDDGGTLVQTGGGIGLRGRGILTPVVLRELPQNQGIQSRAPDRPVVS